MGIKSEVGIAQGMVGGCHAELLDIPVAEVDDAMVFQYYALRLACGARGVQDDMPV